ncbi:hypothetical protein INR49_002726 [Caranx melampygus]|nr:hypothetical protein INR49_002726 [Caranx melampygus]
MEFGLRVAFCLLLVSGTVTVRGSDASDGHAAVSRPKRWSGLSVFDSLRGKGSPSSTKPPARDGAGLNLEDALNPKPAKPAGGDDSRFNLEDALRPAVKPTDKPTGGGEVSGCSGPKAGNRHREPAPADPPPAAAGGPVAFGHLSLHDALSELSGIPRYGESGSTARSP